MPVVGTPQAKSMARGLLAIPGFCCNDGEKEGKSIELRHFGPR